MKFWHRFWSDYFGFNQQQRNGLFVLIMIMLVLFGVRLGMAHFIHPEPMLVADFSHIRFSADSSAINSYEGSSKKEAATAEEGLFVFDPNLVTKAQLLKLGFREKTANTFLSYRNKGAHFSKKEDLKKVYGISEGLYSKLEPFILIGTKEKNEVPAKAGITAAPTKPAKTIELNSADSLALLSLNGIGPSFTRRILKYRGMLGGFVNIDQLKEVYGFETDLFLSIKDKVTVDPALITKLNINTEDFKALNRHPYISYEDAKAVFNCRKKNGAIKNAIQLKEIFTDETAYNKLLPYIKFE
ncbi:MAG: helix-hairpin-helix domain-containing protein [Bacteroidia bacterium]